MRKISTVLTVAALALGLVFSPASALAQGTTAAPVPALTHPTSHPNCDALQHKIEERLAHYRARRDDHLAKFQRIVDRSQKIIDILRHKGYDETLVNNLQTHLIELKGMIADFQRDADAANLKLEEANDFNCGDSEGEFAGRIQEAKDLFAIVRQDVASIKDFFKGTIKADIQALKDSRAHLH